jgi:hypothetical protein
MSDLVVSQTFSLAPRTLLEAMEFAKMMANSELVPKAFRGKPGDVLIAVQMGAEVGLAPMAAIQNIAVINGKPGIYGDAGKAILQAAGCQIEEDDIEVIKKTGRARCKVTRKGRVPVERTFSVENAKTAKLWGKEGPWTNYPERQLAWRAFWFAARDAASDLLKGLGGVEEVQDVEVTVEAPVVATLKAPQRKSELPPVAPDVVPVVVELAAQPVVTVATITEEQWAAMKAKAHACKFSDAQLAAWLEGMHITRGSDVRADEYDDLMSALDAGPRS